MPKPERTVDPARRTRGTVLKSGFSGVAATVVAVTLTSPAGLGGLIGISAAAPSDRDGEYGFPPLSPQLTREEMRGIVGQLDQSNAEMDAVRASTDGEIERIKALAERHRGVRHVTTAEYTPPAFDSYADLAALLLVSRG